MAGLGTVTPRAKRPRRESSGDLGLSATKAGARRRAKSRQREGDRGDTPLRGRDPWERVPRPPLTPRTPGRGRLAKLRLEGERRSLVSAPPCPGAREPASPPPCYKGPYFSGLPADECQDPTAPSLLVPAAPAPHREGPRRTRSTPERTLVLELVSWGGSGGRSPGAGG
ncbi:uncharacterized protein [Nyctibius grandis]|uniref:uncharacterized protein n=1 Tax=Nyctibius grandis TaxID=48427 RepID=UPI0035BC0DDC